MTGHDAAEWAVTMSRNTQFLVSDQPISLGLKYKDISLTTNSLPVVTGLVLIVAALIFWKRKGTSCEERIERLSREHSERLERLMTEQDKKIQKVLIGAEGRAEEVVRG